MNFYKGMTYNFETAVWPVGDYSYKILDIDSPNRKSGFILFGYNREYELGASSRIILSRKLGGQWKERIYKIPFTREGGRLVFDLPAFLDKNGLRYKLYKRYNLYEDGCRAGHSPMIYCKNGDITWGSEWFDGYEYKLFVSYIPGSNCMKIEGKKVSGLAFWGELNPTSTQEILGYFMKTMEECQNLSFRELGEVLDQLKLHKENYSFYINFADGNTISGDKVNWES